MALIGIQSACTQEEVNRIIDSSKAAQNLWAKTPLWKRAELLHKAAAILKEHKSPIAECLVKEIAKPAKDAVTEVCCTSGDFSYLFALLKPTIFYVEIIFLSILRKY